MTDDETFARESRARCAPTACDRRAGCWVVEGKLRAGNNGTPSCQACDGKIRVERWLPPVIGTRVVATKARGA